ncbi:MAG: UDP-N-acetylmuramate--L-alanine ligase [Desulfatibacillaceae bacterium]
MYTKKYSIHFVGIGGIGMSGIAELLLNLGYRVSGSDIRESGITKRLVSLGGAVHLGHDAANVAGADVVVVSSAVGGENPEVRAAREAGVPVIPRAEMLAELMRLKYSVAIAGAHGKTTTTSIVSAVLARGGLDPTVVIGGRLRGIGTNAVLGKGEFIVAEADESDGSFLRMSPSIAVVTNIDREHLDYYEDMDAILDAFAQFLDRVPFYGLSVLCLDSEPVQELLPRLNKRYVTYGMSTQADLQAADVRHEGMSSRFTVVHQGTPLGEVELVLPGGHNVYNALASIAVALELSVPFTDIKAALESLEGVDRRMETKGEVGGVLVLDDYGHHPTEIKATLGAIRAAWPRRRLLVVFQPHRYSRTRALWDDFARAFYHADVLYMLPVYGASEPPVDGVDSEALCADVRAHGHKAAAYLESQDRAVDALREEAGPGDIVLTLGAGDVVRAGERFLARIAGGGP